MTAATVPSCSSVITNGGEICSATPRSARVITPRSSVSAATRSADVAVELDGPRADRSSAPHARGRDARAAAALAFSTGSSSRTRSTRRSGLEHVDVRERDRARRGVARVRVAVARSSVPPSFQNGSAMRPLAITAPSGT